MHAMLDPASSALAGHVESLVNLHSQYLSPGLEHPKILWASGTEVQQWLFGLDSLF